MPLEVGTSCEDEFREFCVGILFVRDARNYQRNELR